MKTRVLWTFALVTCAALLLASVAGAATPAGWWKFDESSGVTAADSSANGNAGSISGSVAWVAGRYNNALTFDGTITNVDCGTGSSLDVGDGTDLSVTFWVRRGIANDFQPIVEKRFSINTGFPGFTVDINAANQVYATFSDGTDSFTMTSAVTIPAGVKQEHWRHVAVVFDENLATGCKIYVDGVEDAGATQTGTLADIGSLVTGTTDFLIGNNYDPGSDFFKGLLDDVRFFKAALTAGEVSAIIAEAPTTTTTTSTTTTVIVPAGIIGWWRLDEIEGTVAYDTSLNGFSGTLMGDAAWTEAGVLGGALQFDGNGDYVDCGAPDGLNVGDNTDMTIMAWVYRDVAAYQDIVNKKDNSSSWGGPNNGYCSYLSDGGIFVTQFGSGEGHMFQMNSTLLIGVGGWHHVVAVFDDDSTDGCMLYVDGVKNTARGVYDYGLGVGNIGSLVSTVSLGMGGAGFFLDGKLDDVRIYNIKLSDAEIAAIYSAGATTTTLPPGVTTTTVTTTSTTVTITTTTIVLNDYILRGWWKMDEGAGTTVGDSSGNGVTGAVSGTPSWMAVGIVGGALNVSDSSSVLGPISHTALNFNDGTDISVAGWVNLTSMPGSQGYLLEKGWKVDYTDGERYGYGVFILPSGAVKAAFADGSTTPFTMTTAAAAIGTGAWHHIAIVVDDSSLAGCGIYIDALPVAVTVTSDPSLRGSFTDTADQAIRIGRSGQDLSMNGSVDDVRLYAKALTASEVEALFLLSGLTTTTIVGGTTTTTTLAAHYHPADMNSDWRMAIEEVTGYGAAWKLGTPWTRPPTVIPIEYVTNAGYLWKLSEVYRYHTSATPLPPWVVGP